MPPYVFLIEVWLAKISFQSLLYQKLSRKTFGVGGPLDPLDQEGLRPVHTIRF